MNYFFLGGVGGEGLINIYMGGDGNFMAPIFFKKSSLPPIQ